MAINNSGISFAQDTTGSSSASNSNKTNERVVINWDIIDATYVTTRLKPDVGATINKQYKNGTTISFVVTATDGEYSQIGSHQIPLLLPVSRFPSDNPILLSCMDLPMLLYFYP